MKSIKLFTLYLTDRLPGKSESLLTPSSFLLVLFLYLFLKHTDTMFLLPPGLFSILLASGLVSRIPCLQPATAESMRLVKRAVLSMWAVLLCITCLYHVLNNLTSRYPTQCSLFSSKPPPPHLPVSHLLAMAVTQSFKPKLSELSLPFALYNLNSTIQQPLHLTELYPSNIAYVIHLCHL